MADIYYPRAKRRDSRCECIVFVSFTRLYARSRISATTLIINVLHAKRSRHYAVGLQIRTQTRTSSYYRDECVCRKSERRADERSNGWADEGIFISVTKLRPAVDKAADRKVEICSCAQTFLKMRYVHIVRDYRR